MVSLVGYTGFVGSNLYMHGKVDRAYNSANIEEAYGTKPDLLIYAGVRAEKYLANKNPTADREQIIQAERNIERIMPQKIILVSTIDVFGNPFDIDEGAEVSLECLPAYGLNRALLEKWVRERYNDAMIVRLPGLYGRNIKKNFIYDLIKIIPSKLQPSIFVRLAERVPLLKSFYHLEGDGFYQCKKLSKEEEKKLQDIFKEINYTALNFTDSRSVYQFYPLSRFWEDMQIAWNQKIPVWHPVTEPVSAGELYEYLTGKKFVNELDAPPAIYNCRTRYAEIFGGKGDYLLNKEEVEQDIAKFLRGYAL